MQNINLREGKRGITLIGLIITVIILMILSGLVISTLSEDVFDEAEGATTNIENTIKEQNNKIVQIKSEDTDVPNEKTDDEHTYGEWTTIQEVTCTQEGERKRICTECGYIQIEITNAIGHIYENEVCTICGATQ